MFVSVYFPFRIRIVSSLINPRAPAPAKNCFWSTQINTKAARDGRDTYLRQGKLDTLYSISYILLQYLVPTFVSHHNNKSTNCIIPIFSDWCFVHVLVSSKVSKVRAVLCDRRSVQNGGGVLQEKSAPVVPGEFAQQRIEDQKKNVACCRITIQSILFSLH